MGALTDHLHITTVILISAGGSAIAAFLLWGFALTKTTLYVFALAYGVFAGGYAATWTGCLAEIQRDSRYVLRYPLKFHDMLRAWSAGERFM